MKSVDYLSMALRRVKIHLFESLIIILAIGLGTGVIAAALALRLSFTDYSQSMAQDEHNRSIYIYAGEDYSFQEDVVPLGEEVMEPASITLETLYGVRDNCPAVSFTILRRGTSLQLGEVQGELGSAPRDPEKYEGWLEEREESYLHVQIATEDLFFMRDMELEMGSFFTRGDILSDSRVIVLGSHAAERLFPHTHPIGERLPILHQRPYTVIGVLKEQDPTKKNQGLEAHEINRGGIIPISTDLWGMRGEADPLHMEIYNFVALVEDVESLEVAKRQIRAYLRENLEGSFHIQSSLGWQRELEPSLARGQIIAAFAASLGLFMASINILNLMMARVLKRTKEIGVLGALGTSRENIFHLFLWEALVLGFLGAVVGFGLALVGERVMASMVEGFTPQVDVRVALASIGIAGLTSLLFGIYPALQAAQIHPVDALRSE